MSQHQAEEPLDQEPALDEESAGAPVEEDEEGENTEALLDPEDLHAHEHPHVHENEKFADEDDDADEDWEE